MSAPTLPQSKYTEQEIWNNIFDASGNQIRTNGNNAGTIQQGTKMTIQEILNSIYDESNHSLKTF